MKRFKLLLLFILLPVVISCKTIDVHVVIPKDYLQLTKSGKLKYSAALYEINTINFCNATNIGNGVYRVRFKLIYGE